MNFSIVYIWLFFKNSNKRKTKIIINADIFYTPNITNKKYIKEECDNNSILYLNSYGPMHDNFSFDNKKICIYKFNPKIVFIVLFNSHLKILK